MTKYDLLMFIVVSLALPVSVFFALIDPLLHDGKGGKDDKNDL